MNYLAGVDEAGLGPILGPLVVAGVAMAGPAGVDPWQELARLVSRHRHQKDRVRVADSKKVHQGPHGLQRLEETVLAFWAAHHGELPQSLGEWLAQLGADLPRLRRCPWYQELDLPLPHSADRGWLQLRAELLARSLQRSGLRLLDLAVRPVDVEEWNALIADTDNKSRAHLHAYLEVVARLVASLPKDRAASEQAHLVADRAGGRMHYRHDLQRLWPGRHIAVLDEQPAVSSYRVDGPDGPLQITFAEKGEDRAFPTALASCCAKYLRELMVLALNRWFQARVPGLQATAGYYVDGHRFLADLAPHLERLAVPTERLVRSR
ncbi:MAG: hypothetical protein JNK49_01435 [Planctomycetes bacterium]|nr:hypothetical protein [Planctomycetota bacterium]